jgi:hypothetical protein
MATSTRQARTTGKGTGAAKATPKAPSRKPTRTREATPRRAPAPAAKAETSRLGKGGLQTLVLEHLHQHRGEEFGPSQLARVLDRSSGAIANALHKFARDEGSSVVQTAERPKRYSIPKNGKGGGRAKR